MFLITNLRNTKMNAPPTQTPALPLDPDTLATLLRTTADALPHHLGTSAEETATLRNAVSIAIARLRPRDPVEALLAARIVAMHYHIMEDLHRAAQPDLAPGLQLRFQARAHALGKLVDAMLFDLRDRQTAPVLWPGALLPASVPEPRAQPAPVPAPRAEPVPVAAPRAQPVPVAAPRAQPAPEAARASTPPPPPPQPPPAEGRHERRRRERAERAERHAAAARAPVRQGTAAAALPAGVAPVGSENAMYQALAAEVAARVAASATALVA
jgi:outer membrane biosynthesis protein TonB